MYIFTFYPGKLQLLYDSGSRFLNTNESKHICHEPLSDFADFFLPLSSGGWESSWMKRIKVSTSLWSIFLLHSTLLRKSRPNFFFLFAIAVHTLHWQAKQCWYSVQPVMCHCMVPAPPPWPPPPWPPPPLLLLQPYSLRKDWVTWDHCWHIVTH